MPVGIFHAEGDRCRSPAPHARRWFVAFCVQLAAASGFGRTAALRPRSSPYARPRAAAIDRTSADDDQLQAFVAAEPGPPPNRRRAHRRCVAIGFRGEHAGGIPAAEETGASALKEMARVSNRPSSSGRTTFMARGRRARGPPAEPSQRLEHVPDSTACRTGTSAASSTVWCRRAIADAQAWCASHCIHAWLVGPPPRTIKILRCARIAGSSGCSPHTPSGAQPLPGERAYMRR